MIAQIRFRTWDGKWTDGTAADKAHACFDQPYNFAGWQWLRDKLAAWCLKRAFDASHDGVKADAWIARYQAIRQIP